MKTKPITIGGLALLIGPTPVVHLADVERHNHEKTANTGPGREAMIAACFHGIRRTRKDCPEAGAITLEWLRENVDIETVGELFSAFADVNLPAPKPGEPVPGEATPEVAS